MPKAKKKQVLRGKDLIEWIKENNAEEHIVIAFSPENEYLNAVDLWEGESGGGAIMLGTQKREYSEL